MAQKDALQLQIFLSARRATPGLTPEVCAMDFSTMLERLKEKIASFKGKVSRGTESRHFGHRYMGMHGEKYKEMSKWFLGQAIMPADKIQRALTILCVNEEITGPPSWSGFIQEIRDEPMPLPSNPVSRAVVEHLTTVLNSAQILCGGLSGESVFDSDRIQLRNSLKAICVAFGVEVIFPEPEAALNLPVTQRQFASIGAKERKRAR